MNQGLLVRLLICIFVLGIALYTYIDKQNDLTSLKMAIPQLVDSVRSLKEENADLSLEIEQLENPSHLIELLRQKEFSHLRYPCAHEVIVCEKK
ncbi:hypothetical protein [Candidatus Neptunochlamydia vexilliferae]|uniref:hypothetical protein n=1 Tax=Candidatus Neptunichlamydia vexilliferae TaxID=1651774 RepID=UPI001891F31E|nr:hypothetical protein [Candidatus Neptunochlamydia vexilliferae]